MAAEEKERIKCHIYIRHGKIQLPKTLVLWHILSIVLLAGGARGSRVMWFPLGRTSRWEHTSCFHTIAFCRHVGSRKWHILSVKWLKLWRRGNSSAQVPFSNRQWYIRRYFISGLTSPSFREETLSTNLIHRPQHFTFHSLWAKTLHIPQVKTRRQTYRGLTRPRLSVAEHSPPTHPFIAVRIIENYKNGFDSKPEIRRFLICIISVGFSIIFLGIGGYWECLLMLGYIISFFKRFWYIYFRSENEL